jgi:hypothetical protein
MYMEMSQGNFLQSYFKQKWFLSKMKNKKVKQVLSGELVLMGGRRI